MNLPLENTLGASYLGHNTTGFRVWAPLAETVEVHLLDHDDRYIGLTRQDHGYFAESVSGVGPGDRYRYRLDGAQELADPASRWQPDGVLGPSAVIDFEQFLWHDSDWSGHPWESLVLYEVHVGTFSNQGRFVDLIADLPRLAALGITAIEIMPIAAFPGERNWGYDGVFPYAAQASYGGPEGFARLVDACHQHQLSLFLDVVYNHTGPEGSVLAQFGPYFNTHYHTPWGQAFNFDGPASDAVRAFFIQNARQWIIDYHVDGLRFDAVHAIIDTSAEPFVRELTRACDAASQTLRRPVHLVAESDRNDPREIMAREREGFGFRGQWNDDLHHALHALITGERDGYYQDFGSLEDLSHALEDGYVYTGQYSSYRERHHGRRYRPEPLNRIVSYSQNHDQIGNRPIGDRLPTKLSDAKRRLVAATIVLAPVTPLLFMGEEYGEDHPFPYFVDHQDPALLQAVRDGRAREWAYRDEAILDPADPNTFWSAKLSLHRNNTLSAWYHNLLTVRREYLMPVLASDDDTPVTATLEAPHPMISLRYRLGGAELQVWLNFSPEPAPYGHDDHIAVLINSATPERLGTACRSLPTPSAVPGDSCLVTYCH